MVKCFGQSFTDALPERLAHYAERWVLKDFTLIEYFSVNCLFLCCSEKFGDCVLKIFGCSYEWYIDEIRALRELKGQHRYVRAYEYDEEHGALLLECIHPGTTLKHEPSLERRLAVFIDIWQNAHIALHEPARFKTYLQMTEEAVTKKWACGENPELRRAALLMTSVCGDLYEKYTEQYLLHGDLHGDNLLKNIHGDYIMVDPHARIGPPICDLGRYITNEYNDADKGNSASAAEFVIASMSAAIKLPANDIIRAFFVDATLMACWDAEDGAVNLDGVHYAETLLIHGLCAFHAAACDARYDVFAREKEQQDHRQHHHR
jgi:streptomycin 6-kinase